MANNKLISLEQQALILEKTPKQYIKTRPGPSGYQLHYVETGYVIKRLNEAFNYLWDFKVTEQTIGKKQVYVKGSLTAYITPELSITKEQFGGVDIKFSRSSNEAVSIADDLKAAGSDALKKCASLFGIAQDVFWPDGVEEVTVPLPVKKVAVKTPESIYEDMVTDIQIAQIRSMLIAKHYKEASLLEKFEVNRLSDLTIEQADSVITNLKKLPIAKIKEEENIAEDAVRAGL